ncbi:MAG: endonuclease domain-containing protein [Flavobacteriales bacterium]|nr:endonuclease domain-containing protein [Flavobacteriales bacterium]
MPDQVHNKKELKQHRKDLRNHLTPAEAELWTYLKHTKLGQKFRRQHSVGYYILDFYCPQSKLCVELDGAHHFTPESQRYDERRSRCLEKFGIRVIRFENEDVFNKLPDVLNSISAHFIR